jgi:hypothetical protein
LQIIHLTLDLFDLGFDVGKFLIDPQGFIHCFGAFKKSLDAFTCGFKVGEL